MSTTRTIMYAQFEESPGDLAAYGAIADDLESDGYFKLAHAFRWMYFRGRFPHKRSHYCRRNSFDSQSPRGRKVPNACRWAWYCGPRYPSDTEVRGVLPKACRETHGLPPLLLYGDQKIFASHQAAVMFLAEQLAKVGETYNCEPPGPRGLPLYDVIDTGRERVPPPFFASDESLAGEEM